MARAAAEVEAAVRKTGLLVGGRPVLVMFSGGRDSTCLLDLAVRIAGAGSVRALHVNYGLRAGALLDERHCESVCADLRVPLSVAHPPGPERSGNLQAWAREIRYTAATAAAAGADVAAGHTAGDQLETILYRLISSPSRRALLGMAPRRGGLIRPLLSVTREETGAYCVERSRRYRDDPSNASPSYIRNRIRNELVPLLSDLHPGAEPNILALADILRGEGEVLDEEVARVAAAHRDMGLDHLRGLPHGLARLLVQHLADGAVGQPAAGVARRTEEILEMGDDAIQDLPNGVRAITQAGFLRFERTPPLQR
jgi:tRNA(Ile)-lysidine synthase